MKVGLFIPCYVDQFYPKAAIATLQLLEKLGVDVVFPRRQTCCGQPMANSGFEDFTKSCNDLLIKNFSDFDYVVAPSASCILHIKEHLHSERNENAAEMIRTRAYEITEFLVDVLKITEIKARFPYRVGVHLSCHGLRGLHLSKMSELVGPPFSKIDQLLKMVEGIDLVVPDRPDECCGFGGTFCVTEAAVSVKMGKDRTKDHSNYGAEYITSSDLSCLMHLDGILQRQRSNIKTIHIVEILNSTI